MTDGSREEDAPEMTQEDLFDNSEWQPEEPEENHKYGPSGGPEPKGGHPDPKDAPGPEGKNRIIIVTGGAGFIGSNLIKKLNNDGKENILIVDDLTDPKKLQNIAKLRFQDYTDKSKFIELFGFMAENGMVDCIYHFGAESATTCDDGKYLMENNYQYTCNLMDICAMNKVPMVYASSAAVYGNSTVFDDKSDDYIPTNYYGLSKLQADRYSRKFMALDNSKIIGLRYFNVCSDGEFEQHKEGMKSATAWMKEEYERIGQVTVFTGSDEMKRDFIPIDQVIYCTMNAMHNGRSGVYNIGTGTAKSFLELAEEATDSKDKIRFIPMPSELKEHYQSFTQADMSNACFSIPGRP
jgi:ADP-L-glycero-D-manno-heptose 6-epimerase